MESLANQLRMEMLKYNKYGTAEDVERATNVFDKVIDLAFVAARNGYNNIKFSEDTLPRRSVEYFKHLCEDEGIKFEMTVHRTPDDAASYTICWE